MNGNTSRSLILGGIGLFVVLIVGGLVWAIMAGPGPTSANGTTVTNVSFNDDNDPTVGPADAALVVHIFGDIQCPACREAEPGLRYAMDTYKDKVKFVWDDFPLTTLHPNARIAATASRCAEAQGKFWEFRDMLYDNQPDWADLAAPTNQFVTYAKSLGLDTNSFTSCVAEDTYSQKIANDMAEGNSDNVEATPTFFIGNVKVEGGMTNAQWDQEITSQLPKS
ncbi:MAG: thioredoxin domain-containing protein [Patescibacteria group bacterium]